MVGRKDRPLFDRCIELESANSVFGHPRTPKITAEMKDWERINAKTYEWRGIRCADETPYFKPRKAVHPLLDGAYLTIRSEHNIFNNEED